MLPLILVIEPDDGVRRTIVRLLRSDALRVTAAHSIEDARSRLGTDQPHVLIAELGGSNGSNAEWAECIQAGWPGVPIIWTSGAAPASGHGPTVLHKPFSRAALLALVRGALGRRARDAD